MEEEGDGNDERGRGRELGTGSKRVHRSTLFRASQRELERERSDLEQDAKVARLLSQAQAIEGAAALSDESHDRQVAVNILLANGADADVAGSVSELNSLLGTENTPGDGAAAPAASAPAASARAAAAPAATADSLLEVQDYRTPLEVNNEPGRSAAFNFDAAFHAAMNERSPAVASSITVNQAVANANALFAADAEHSEQVQTETVAGNAALSEAAAAIGNENPPLGIVESDGDDSDIDDDRSIADAV